MKPAGALGVPAGAGNFVVFTHTRPDLDAASTVWLVERFLGLPRPLEVRFVPAGTSLEELKTLAEGTPFMAVDMSAGVKGERIRDANGNVRILSAFSTILNDLPQDVQALLRDYAAALDIHDSTGNLPRAVVPGLTDEQYSLLGVCGLAHSFACVTQAMRAQTQAIHREEHGEDAPQDVLDEATVTSWSFYLDGLLELNQKRAEQVRSAGNATWFDGPRGRVALYYVQGGEGRVVTGKLMDMGASAVVYVDGYNLGVARARGCDIDLLDAAQHLLLAAHEYVGEWADWFHHPSGFVLAHGTSKSPKTKKSRVDPTQLAQAIANAL